MLVVVSIDTRQQSGTRWRVLFHLETLLMVHYLDLRQTKQIAFHPLRLLQPAVCSLCVCGTINVTVGMLFHILNNKTFLYHTKSIKRGISVSGLFITL